MAFQTGNASTASAEINVTPLIDVLLVLLIIFMVIVPIVPRGLSGLLPQTPKEAAAAVPETPLVVQLRSLPNGTVGYMLNQQALSSADLRTTLARLLVQRQDKAMFVRGTRDLQFSEVAQVIGWGRQASADRIGILTPEMEAPR